jgi:hypothetical protein
MGNSKKPPFFVVGAPRSGTTMLRDLLRMHSQLEAPEETHFYRWPQPFKSPEYRAIDTKNKTLIRHRAIDGISDSEFLELFDSARSRRECQDAYMDLFLKKRGAEESRWFDKTPQNAYAAHILAADYPGAKLVHIVRNPLNVVASLRTGKIIQQKDLDAAINYWCESVAAIDVVQKAFPNRVTLVRYEDCIERPEETSGDVFNFIGEEPPHRLIKSFEFKPEQNKYLSVLSNEEVSYVERRCKVYREKLGYAG